MSSQPKLRSDLLSSSAEIDNQLVYTLSDPIRGTYFRLRAPEFWLIQQLDGQTTMDQIAARFNEQFGANLSGEAVESFVAQLGGLFFLETTGSENVTSRLGSQAKRSFLERLLFIKLKAFAPGKLLDWLTAIYRPFHSWPGFVAMAVIALGGLLVLVTNQEPFAIQFAQLFSLFSIGSIVAAVFLVLGLHEFAHAVVCRLYGGQVREIGFLLLYLQPCFYCDVSDAWLFPEKRKRLAVTWAGPLCQLLVMAIAIFVWRLSIPESSLAQFARIVVLVSWINLLFNFNPLIKLDGYYLLSDWLEIPNLRTKAFAFLGNAASRKLLGWQLDPIEVTPRERTIFLSYALLSGGFTIVLLGSLAIWLGEQIRTAGGRFGFALYILSLLAIFLPRIGRFASDLIRYRNDMKQFIQQPVRLALIGTAFVGVLLLGLAVPFPQRVSGDVLIEPISVFTVAFNDQGLLEQSLRTGGSQPSKKTDFVMMTTTSMAALQLQPVVRNGQQVAIGDTVAVLSSNQITSEIAEAIAERDRLNGELALLQAKPKKERIDEARADVNAAKARFNQLKKDRDRISELVKKSLETNQKLEESNASFEVARAALANKESTLRLLMSPPRPEEEAVIRHEVEKQEARLEFLRKQASAQVIMSPIGGVAATGSGSGTLVTVTTQSSVELRVSVSDYDLSLIQLDQPVQVMVRSFPGRTFEGRVVRIPESADSLGGLFGFPVSVVVENPEGLLKEGMTGYAKIETGRNHLFGQAGRKLLSFLRVEFWSWW